MIANLVYINFHGIGPVSRVLDPGEEEVWISAERFEQMLDVLQDRPNVCLTFDDGNRSDVEIALPALVRRSMAATFFIVADRLGRPEFVDGDDLHTLRDSGMGIGCHGMQHRPWQGLSDDALEVELVMARELLAKAVGQPVREAACPFGAYDRRVIRGLRQAGYERVYTSDRGLARQTGWLIPRNTVHHDDTVESVKSMLAPWPVPRRWQAGLRQLVKRWR